MLGFPTGDSHTTRDLRYDGGRGVLHTMHYRDLYWGGSARKGYLFQASGI